MTAFSNHLNSTYFDNRLSARNMAALDHIEGERLEVRHFAERLSRFFCAAKIDATDVPLTFGRGLRDVMPHILPGAWDGMVPSITYSNRHVRIDDYLAGNRWCDPGPSPKLLDIGCGFPPLTSLDTAVRFPNWSIVAIDRAHWPYMVIDALGDRAVFDEERTVRYFQPKQPGPSAWRKILRNKEATRAHFGQLLDELIRNTPEEVDHTLAVIEFQGARLILNPAVEYSRPNLRFVKSDLLAADLPEADFVRCFNVLPYFDDPFRQKVLSNVGKSINDGGLFVAGSDWAETMLARYMVYRKENGKLVAKEFAFTLDYLRASTNFFALHDDEEEMRLLVGAIAALRGDRQFFTSISSRLDALHQAAPGVSTRRRWLP